MTNNERRPFTTIDDVVGMAEMLMAGLYNLAERKHPLAVRKASQMRKEVIDEMTGNVGSEQVKAGGKTYFIDVATTRENKKYLRITESRFKGEGKDRERSSIVVFAEHVKEFVEAINKMADTI